MGKALRRQYSLVRCVSCEKSRGTIMDPKVGESFPISRTVPSPLRVWSLPPGKGMYTTFHATIQSSAKRCTTVRTRYNLRTQSCRLLGPLTL